MMNIWKFVRRIVKNESSIIFDYSFRLAIGKVKSFKSFHFLTPANETILMPNIMNNASWRKTQANLKKENTLAACTPSTSLL